MFRVLCFVTVIIVLMTDKKVSFAIALYALYIIFGSEIFNKLIIT